MKKLIVQGSMRAEFFTFTHKGKEYKRKTIQQCRDFAEKNGYKGIWIDII